VEINYLYNAIFERGLSNTFKADLHSGYLCLKVSGTFRIISIFNSQKDVRNIKQGFMQYQQLAYPVDIKAPAKFKKANIDFMKFLLDPRVPYKDVCLGTKTIPEEQEELLAFLYKNSDVFEWSTSNLIGASRDIIEHRMQVSPNAKARKQKLHKMSEEKVETAKSDVQRLLDVGFVREVTYPQCFANVVVVQKRMENGGRTLISLT
jgi:hypothetical protein